jgi:outer membrane protein OmpA-like peptidoglycan-associated protein
MHTRSTLLTLWARRSTTALAGLSSAALLLGACASPTPPSTQPMLSAQEAVTSAASAGAVETAPTELRSVRDKLAIAREAVDQRAAEASLGNAGAARDAIRLNARTEEARVAQQQMHRSQMQTDLVRAENRALQERLRELKARLGPRGMVLTLDDVLFNSDQAQLKPAGLRLVDQLTVVLKEHPRRTVTIEGFTDSTGTEAHNLALSSQRADMVGTVLRDAGISADRMSMRGMGESSPVASNQSAEGRALNRRVEIVLSDGVWPHRPR